MENIYLLISLILELLLFATYQSLTLFIFFYVTTSIFLKWRYKKLFNKVLSLKESFKITFFPNLKAIITYIVTHMGLYFFIFGLSGIIALVLALVVLWISLRKVIYKPGIDNAESKIVGNSIIIGVIIFFFLMVVVGNILTHGEF